MTKLTIASLLLVSLLGCVSADGDRPDERTAGETESDLLEASYDRFVDAKRRYERLRGGTFEGLKARHHYLHWGESGPAVIWLHGTYSSAYEFAPFAERLAEQGHRVIAMDCYGHGGTSIPDGEVSIQDAADELAVLMDRLGIEKAVVGGWSRGAGIAAVFQEAHPERVRGLVLVDGGSWSLQTFTESLSEVEIRDWLEGGHDPVTGDFRIRKHDSAFDHFASLWSSRPIEERDDHVAHLSYMAALARGEPAPDGGWLALRRSLFVWLRQSKLEDAIRGMTRTSQAPLFLRSFSVMIPSVVFRHLAVPTLIIDPRGDFMDMTAQNRSLEALHPEWIEIKSYEEAGHSVMAQEPERFAADLERFLERLQVQR